MATAPVEQAAIEQAVRRYVLRLARRYVPLVAAGVALILVLVLVPPATGPKTRTVATGAGATGANDAAGATGEAGPAAGGGAANGSTGASGQANFKSTGRQLAVPAGI